MTGGFIGAGVACPSLVQMNETVRHSEFTNMSGKLLSNLLQIFGCAIDGAVDSVGAWAR